MRKLLILLAIVPLMTACPNLSDDNYTDKWYWMIYNDTDRALTIRYPDLSSIEQGGSEYKEFTIEQGKYIPLFYSETNFNRVLSFEYFFEQSAERFGENVNWQILSEDRTVLKTWTYEDRDQRFFNKSEWDYNSSLEEWFPSGSTNVWNFMIKSEDIVSK